MNKYEVARYVVTEIWDEGNGSFGNEIVELVLQKCKDKGLRPSETILHVMIDTLERESV